MTILWGQSKEQNKLLNPLNRKVSKNLFRLIPKEEAIHLLAHIIVCCSCPTQAQWSEGLGGQKHTAPPLQLLWNNPSVHWENVLLSLLRKS